MGTTAGAWDEHVRLGVPGALATTGWCNHTISCTVGISRHGRRLTHPCVPLDLRYAEVCAGGLPRTCPRGAA